MKNILIDLAPVTLNIGGEGIPINYGFRTGIMCEQAMIDPDIPNEERFESIMYLLFCKGQRRDEYPEYSESVLREVVSFLTCEKAEKPKSGAAEQIKTDSKKIYSFDHDDELIFAAFWHDYKIDLEAIDEEELHWWKFRALFSGLNTSNRICEIMGYRGADLKKLKGKQREEAARLQRLHALPQGMSRTETEKNEAAQAWLAQMAENARKKGAADE